MLRTVLVFLSWGAFAIGAAGAIYSGWCVRQARCHVKSGVPWWKLHSTLASSTYEFYDRDGHEWVRRATLAQALVPLGFFGGLALRVIAESL